MHFDISTSPALTVALALVAGIIAISVDSLRQLGRAAGLGQE